MRKEEYKLYHLQTDRRQKTTRPIHRYRRDKSFCRAIARIFSSSFLPWKGIFICLLQTNH